MSARSLRIAFTVMASVIFVMATYNIFSTLFFNATSNDECAWRDVPPDTSRLAISQVLPGGTSDQAGIKNGDFLLRINGKSFKNSGAAQTILNAVAQGDTATYLLERNGKQMEARVKIYKLFNVQSLALYLLGLGFLVVGYVVVMTKPQGIIQRMFGWYGIMTMMVFGLFGVSLPAGIPGWIRLIYTIFIVAGRALGPGVFVHFFFYFPVRGPFAGRKWVIALLYIFSVIITALLVIYQNSGLAVLLVLAEIPIAYFIVGLGLFARGYFRMVDRVRRSQLTPVLVASAVDIAVFTYALVVLTVNPFLFLLHPIVLGPLLLIVALPLAFGYSIFRYRVMDIDLIIKRSLIYGSVTAIVAAMYLLIVFGIGQLVGIMFGRTNNQILTLTAFVIIALMFDPVKRRAQEWIDKIFYAERLNYQKALLEFSQELPRQMNMEEILHSIINRISSTMHVDKISVVVCDEISGCSTLDRNVSAESSSFADEEGGLIAFMRSARTPQSFALLAEEPESVKIHERDRKRILDSGIILSVPMMLNERLVGMINVGEKLSGKVYSQEDIDLLSTVASQAAIAIENARLHKSEIEKERMEEELDIARRIQQGLLPKCDPVVKNLDICGVSIPALSVGGDYYDYIRLRNGKLLVVVADVSGKGMSAALYMSKIQGMLQLAAHMYESPKQMLIEVNRRLYEGIERKSFITMVLGLFDPENNEVTICRAGHNKPLISFNGELRFAEGAGIGLGLEPGPIFESELEEVRQKLEPGRLFVFYSDGLTEAMNDKHEQFGDATVHDLVQSKRGLASEKILESVLEGVKKFRGDAVVHDDITVVVVKAR
ncbi:MAG TPA: SpoIIE family protein phosphatase [Bacteroidota bacterium]|nr:SpoIIE family protein phosphatase [Bacteroidota bacterium]